MQICMLVTTDVTSDPRVMKEATLLVHNGHKTHVIGACRSGEEPRTEINQGVEVSRIDLWHTRFVRWLKKRQGMKHTQSMLESHKSTGKTLISSLRGVSIAILYQIYDVVHLFFVFWNFSFAAWRIPADVIFAHDIEPLLVAVVVGRLKNMKIFYDSHEDWGASYGRPLSEWFYKTIERVCVPICDHVFTVNQPIADLIAHRNLVPTPSVILNVPDFDEIIKPPPLPDGKNIELLYHGYFQPGRGLDLLVRSMLYVSSPVHLTLRGDGVTESSLKNLVAELGLEERVDIVPKVPMKQIIPASLGYHVGVMPFIRSRLFSNTLPNKLFEYMAAGLAILSNDLTEIGRIVRQYEIGLIYSSENPQEIAEAVDLLATDRKCLERMRFRSVEVYHQHYRWSQQGHVLLDAIDSLRPVG